MVPGVENLQVLKTTLPVIHSLVQVLQRSSLGSRTVVQAIPPGSFFYSKQPKIYQIVGLFEIRYQMGIMLHETRTYPLSMKKIAKAYKPTHASSRSRR